MPFTKGNQLWKEGLKTKVENKTRLQQFHEILAEGGSVKYGEMMEELAEGNELSPPKREYMDRYERHLEFVTAKLARTESVQATVDLNQMDVEKAREITDSYLKSKKTGDTQEN